MPAEHDEADARHRAQDVAEGWDMTGKTVLEERLVSGTEKRQKSSALSLDPAAQRLTDDAAEAWAALFLASR
jgi:hypothetical protein